MRLGVRARGRALVSLSILLCSVLVVDSGIEDIFIQPGSNPIDAGLSLGLSDPANDAIGVGLSVNVDSGPPYGDPNTCVSAPPEGANDQKSGFTIAPGDPDGGGGPAMALDATGSAPSFFGMRCGLRDAMRLVV